MRDEKCGCTENEERDIDRNALERESYIGKYK
jgi:hypothetical protein